MVNLKKKIRITDLATITCPCESSLAYGSPLMGSHVILVGANKRLGGKSLSTERALKTMLTHLVLKPVWYRLHQVKPCIAKFT
jgi:hypothetical protein